MVSIEKRPWGRFERFTLNEPCTVKLVYVDGDKRLNIVRIDKGRHKIS